MDTKSSTLFDTLSVKYFKPACHLNKVIIVIIIQELIMGAWSKKLNMRHEQSPNGEKAVMSSIY